jgi:hypothetical protein
MKKSLTLLIASLALSVLSDEGLTKTDAVNVNPANANLPTPPPDSQNKVTIAWTLSLATNVVGQTVAWGVDPTNYVYFVNVAANTTQYQIQGLQPSTTYYISVYCSQLLGETQTNIVRSYYANEIVVTTAPTARPAPPSNVKLISQP